MPVTLLQSTIPYSDIGIATCCNQLNLVQWSPMATLKMYPRNLRKILIMVTLTKPPYLDPGFNLDPEPEPEPEHNEGNLIKSVGDKCNSGSRCRQKTIKDCP
jgi:hypothetical protein